MPKISTTHKSILIVTGVSIALTALGYGSAVHLPFYSDDLLQAPWVEATPLLHFWRQVGPYGDYRPLHFTLWRLLYLLTGMLSPASLHLINLMGHALCGALVGRLALRRDRRQWFTASLVTAVFILFPLTFDAVLWVSSFSYPLTTALSLGALLTYLRAREQENTHLHFLALLLTALAGLAYEGGVVAGVAIVWAELTLRKRPFSRWAIGQLLASLAPLSLVYVNSSTISLEFITGQALVSNAAMALQGLAFPLAPLAIWGKLGVGPIWLMAALGLLTLLGLAYLAHRQPGQFRWFLWGAGWWLLWSFIPLTTQPFNWLRDPARVFYPGTVGVALLWGNAVAGHPAKQRPHSWVSSAGRWGLRLALSLALLLPAGWFLLGEVALYRRTGDFLWTVIRAAQARPDTLFINLPGRITSAGRFYPLGHEGVIPLPPPTNGELLIAVHSGWRVQSTARSAGIILPPQPFTLELADPPLNTEDLRAASQVIIVTYTSGGMSLETVGAIFPPQEIGQGLVTVGETLSLRAASCAWTGPEQITVKTEWQALAPGEGMPTIFTHWLGADGALVAQADGDPLQGLYPIAQWQAGEVVQDVRVINDAPPGEGVVTLGVWDPASGERWQITTMAGQILPDEGFRLDSCTAQD